MGKKSLLLGGVLHLVNAGGYSVVVPKLILLECGTCRVYVFAWHPGVITVPSVHLCHSSIADELATGLLQKFRIRGIYKRDDSSSLNSAFVASIIGVMVGIGNHVLHLLDQHLRARY